MLADLVDAPVPANTGEMPEQHAQDAFVDVDALLNARDYTDLIDVLQQLGVGPTAACRFVNAIRKTPRQTFMQLYGQGQIQVAASHGGR